MKHQMGNSPRCDECRYYREKNDGESLRYPNTGWCLNQKAQGVNGHRQAKPKERFQTAPNGCCSFWIDAESGNTKFEVMTGYKEPYDGSHIDLN